MEILGRQSRHPAAIPAAQLGASSAPVAPEQLSHVMKSISLHAAIIHQSVWKCFVISKQHSSRFWMLLWEFHLHSTIDSTAQRSRMASTMMILGYVQRNAVDICYCLTLSLFSYWFTLKLYHCFKPGLRELPGPKIAAWTRLWRVWAVLSGMSISHGNW